MPVDMPPYARNTPVRGYFASLGWYNGRIIGIPASASHVKTQQFEVLWSNNETEQYSKSTIDRLIENYDRFVSEKKEAASAVAVPATTANVSKPPQKVSPPPRPKVPVAQHAGQFNPPPQPLQPMQVVPQQAASVDEFGRLLAEALNKYPLPEPHRKKKKMKVASKPSPASTISSLNLTISNQLTTITSLEAALKSGEDLRKKLSHALKTCEAQRKKLDNSLK